MKLLVVAIAAWSCVACGTVASPIPPENVGVTPLIERQKKADEEAAKASAPESQPLMEPEGQDVNLPPLRPVGTR